MRRLALIAIVLGSAAATAAGAATTDSASHRSLDDWLASAPPAAAQTLSSSDVSAADLANAAFAPRTAAPDAQPLARVMDRETYVPGDGLVRWNTNEVQLSNAAADGPVDTLRVSVGGTLRTPGGLPLNLDRSQFQPQAYEISVIRDWPGALSYGARGFDVDLSPRAGVGMTNLGASAEAGAELRVSKRGDAAADRLRAMGVKDGARFGDQGRWYLFAAASGRAVGLNMLKNDNGWDRAGWTTDSASSLVGDAQLGVGWRRGDLQTSLGYVHREMKGAHMIFGQDTREDSMVAFSLSIKPNR